MLCELGIANGALIAISRVLGMSIEEEGVDEKNKQFVGDLLFGQGELSFPNTCTNGRVTLILMLQYQSQVMPVNEALRVRRLC